MRKHITIPTTEDKEEVYCDACGKKQEHFSVCSVCERDLCHDCFGSQKEIKAFYLIPCSICRTIKKYIPKIKKEWELSTNHKEKAFELQEEWGKESREKGVKIK